MEFIKNIAPVIVAGIVCVIVVFTIKRKRTSGDHSETYMVEGIAMGLCLGAAIGSAMPAYLSYVISLGMLTGFLVGMQIKK